MTATLSTDTMVHVEVVVRDEPVIQRGDCAGGRHAYVDSDSQLKVILELPEND